MRGAADRCAETGTDAGTVVVMDLQPTTPPSTVPAAPSWPPGWYPLDPSTLAWWDGTAWSGHVQPLVPVRREEESGAFAASFAWWGSLLVGFWPALIIFLTNGPSSQGSNRFARYSAGEALNVHLSVLCVLLPVYALVVGSFYLSMGGTAGDELSPVVPVGFFAVWALIMCVGLATAVVYVLAAVRAHAGVWWQARYAIPFLRAHRALAPAV